MGLSSPTGYFFDHEREFTKDQPWQWNPILESPLGLVTLFDEIWFAHQALCPKSMRNLEFVRFLYEDPSYKPLLDRTISMLQGYNKKEIEGKFPKIKELPNERIQRFREVVGNACGYVPGRDAPIDNHSHGIDFGGVVLSGNAWSSKTLVTDLLLVELIKKRTRHPIELVTNFFTGSRLEPPSTTHAQIGISQGITVERIPVAQNREGPILLGIDDIRQNPFLAEFRKKVESTTKGEEVTEVPILVAQVENEFEKYRNEFLIKQLRSARVLNSFSRNAVSLISGGILPLGVLETVGLIKDYKTRRMNWTGFIACLERRRERRQVS